MNSLTDKQSREIIFNDLYKNIFVEAGAGSGKTTSLVKRIVNLIKYGITKDGITTYVTTDQICTITFTKIAANEFKSRFQKRLYEDLAEEKDEEVKERLQKAINEIDLAFMGTIDSFCKKIIDEDPLSANVPYSSKIIDDADLKLEAENLFKELSSGAFKDKELLKGFNDFCSLFDNAKKVFITCLSEICENPECITQFVEEDISKTIDERFANEIKVFKEIINCIDDNFYTEKAKPENVDKQIKNLHDIRKYLSVDWQPHIKKIDKLLYYFDRDTQSYNKITLQRIREVDGHEIYLPDNKKTLDIKFLVNQIKNYKFSIAASFLEKCKKSLLESLRDKGNLRFADNLIYCRDMLKNDANTKDHKLIKRLQKKYKYFFLDEFQDTDPIQIQIFFYLAAEEIKPEWNECIPFDGSLFIVGDPKQSIYKFKGADIISYNRIKEIFYDLSKKGKGQVLELTENFRSRNALINHFNKVFANTLNGLNNQASYSPIPLHDDEVRLKEEKLLEGPYQIKDIDKDLPKYLPNLVKNIKDNYKIIRSETRYDENGERINYQYLDSIRYDDFMIITPSKSKLSDIIKNFDDVNIPYHIRGVVDFKNCELLFNIYLILNYLNEPTNRNKAAVLYSSLFNFTTKDMYNLMAEKKKIDGSFDNLIEKIQPLYDEYKYKFSILIEKLGQLKEIIEFSDLRTYNTYYFILEYIKKAEADGEITGIESLLDFLSKLFEGGYKEKFKQNLSFSKYEDKVMIANAHQVKGAEASIVILAMESVNNIMPKTLLNYAENKKYIFRIEEDSNVINKSSLLSCDYYDTMKQKDVQLMKNERNRVEYVAATRAKNVLIICSNGKKAENRAYRNLYDNYELPELNNLLNYDNFDLGERKHLNIEDLKLKEFGEDNKKRTYKTKNPSKEVSKPIKDHDYIYDKPTLLINYDPTQAGTLVHRLCELVVLSKNSIDREKIIKSILQEYSIEKDNYNICKIILENAARSFIDNKDSLLYNLLNADEVLTEAPFSFNDDNEIVQGYIDVIYKKDGQYHIIDYKTNKNTENLDEEYENQLNLYIKAAKICLGIDCDAKTYSIPIKDYYEN